MARKVANRSAACTVADVRIGCCKVESIVSVDDRGQMVLPKDVRGKGRSSCWRQVGRRELGETRKSVLHLTGQSRGYGRHGARYAWAYGEGDITGIGLEVFEMKEDRVKKGVRQKYGELARTERSCCDPANCCGLPKAVSKKIGYTDDELVAVPEGANLGLGCGNPVAIASLKEGETVLDLGSGAGFDCFLAANKVGRDGKVIGVDMTPEMIEKAMICALSSTVRLS